MQLHAQKTPKKHLTPFQQQHPWHLKIHHANDLNFTLHVVIVIVVTLTVLHFNIQYFEQSA